MPKAVVLSGFPGVGKSYFKNNSDLKVLDSDSSKFSWLPRGVAKRNPDFPVNYIRHIEKHLDRVDLILVSSHSEVRNSLREEGINFILVYPDKNLMKEYLQRFANRGSPQAFLDLLAANWDDWMAQLEQDDALMHVNLKSGQYLSDIVPAFI